MKPDKQFASNAVILIATAGLIALTWLAAIETIRAQRQDIINRASATLANEALALGEQIDRQILGFDQTLKILATAWEANPRGFDLEAWRRQTFVLDGLSRDMVLTDENGVIRQSSVVEVINQNVSALDYFRTLADPSDAGDRLYIGPAAIDGIMRQWHMNVARALHYPDGSFAGVIDADYRISAITDGFGEANLGPGAFLALVGLDDGKLRGAVGATSIDPDANVSDTPMFAALQGGGSGVWTGPSANDAVERIHAFRHVPGRRLAVIVGLSEEQVLRVAKPWRRGTELAAGLVTVLLAGLALALIRGNRLARRRVLETAEHRAELAAGNAQFEVARAMAAVRTEQLEATLGGMIDGVSLVDGHLCLVEWNALYPGFAGVPPEILRVGLPMEEILRAQIRSGQFGPVDDPETEVAFRIARLRSARSEVVRRQRPDGHVLELRRTRMPDGGFVTIYRDVTEYDQADRSPSTGTAAMDVANQEGSEFSASIADGARTQADAGLNGDGDESGPTRSVEDLSAGPEVPPADLPPRASPRTRVLLGGNIVAGHGVTATLLRRAGHHVDVAPDGPAVIGSMRTAPYDLALVDFDMAGIDGKQITALIRALPEPACATPVIARTRDLSADQVAAVRAAGLDGVLANPVSLTELMGILRDHVWARSATAGQVATATDPDHGRQRAPSALSMARINALRATLPAAILVDAVEDCLVDLERRLPALRRSLNARAPAAIIAHAQVMTGMAATYGMTALEGRLRAIVDAAREGDLTPLGASVVADLDSDYEEASRTLRDMLRTETV